MVKYVRVSAFLLLVRSSSATQTNRRAADTIHNNPSVKECIVPISHPPSASERNRSRVPDRSSSQKRQKRRRGLRAGGASTPLLRSLASVSSVDGCPTRVQTVQTTKGQLKRGIQLALALVVVVDRIKTGRELPLAYIRSIEPPHSGPSSLRQRKQLAKGPAGRHVVARSLRSYGSCHAWPLLLQPLWARDSTIQRAN